jgi:hypothetical protein
MLTHRRSILTPSSVLEAACSSEMSVSACMTTHCHNSEDYNLNSRGAIFSIALVSHLVILYYVSYFEGHSKPV